VCNLIALSLLICLFQPIARPPVFDVNRIDQLLEPIRQKNNLPSLAGAVLTSKGLVSIGATGVRKAGTNVAVTTDDLWHLGSDTKAMTATMIGSLVERGKLKWDSTIEDVFPDLAKSFPPDFAKITLTELLCHHAGVPENIDWRSQELTGSMMEQRRKVVQIAASMKLIAKPGAEFHYSNLGYVIAAAMAEKITGEPWEELITKAVFKPLGMSSVGFGGTGTPGNIDQPWPHYANGKPTEKNGPAVDNPPVMGPAGTVHCSLSDWAKFVADQMRGQLGEHGILKPETYIQLHTPRFGGDYAFGWGVLQRPWGGGTVYSHAGSNTVNFAVVWMAPAKDFAVLVVTNEGGEAAAKGSDEAASALIVDYLKAK